MLAIQANFKPFTFIVIGIYLSFFLKNMHCSTVTNTLTTAMSLYKVYLVVSMATETENLKKRRFLALILLLSNIIE